MKINKIITGLVLLFTITTLASCVNGKTKDNNTKSTESVTQTNPPIKRVAVKEFQENIEGKEVQLVDVRTLKEFKQGHLENADNVDVMNKSFMDKMAKYKKDVPVYVYCRSGGRSMKAAKMLQSKGFQVVNLNGGFRDWSEKGLKTVK